MGQQDLQPENSGASAPQATEALLRAMTQDIENLRQNLVVQLSQDVERLQREKSHLIEEIEQLQAQRQQQIVQQQKLVRQIAPALANQLQELLTQQLNQLADSSRISDKEAGSGLPSTSTASEYNQNAYRLIASLDATLRTTFKTLQQDLSSYQSSLAQQLGQMYSLEQQGEAILDTLVSRLREQIQSESSAITSTPLPPPAAPDPPSLPRRDASGIREDNHKGSTVSDPSVASASAVPLVRKPEPPAAIPQPLPQPQPTSKLQIGFLLILVSSLVLSFQNVVITVILNKSEIFGGLFRTGGFILPSLGNSLLILWLRMVVVVPLMGVLATVLYPGIWRDIKLFAQSKDWSLFIQVLSSGFFLFLSQVLIYLALGPISPGVAITIFFVYPIFTVLLAWVLFGDRPSLFRSVIIIFVLLGVVLIALPSSGAGKLNALGVSAAIGSGITFAFYVILTQACAKKLNPIPFSWINFVVILAFSSLSLFTLPESLLFEVDSRMWPSLIISCLVLGGTTLLSYLFNNIGISMIGAARASILGATGPALTALLAWAIIQRALYPQQIWGMLLVSLGVAALSFERLRSQTKKAQPAVRKSK
jgi:drug/metabolite transporter (DMT)-like permease